MLFRLFYTPMTLSKRQHSNRLLSTKGSRLHLLKLKGWVSKIHACMNVKNTDKINTGNSNSSLIAGLSPCRYCQILNILHKLFSQKLKVVDLVIFGIPPLNDMTTLINKSGYAKSCK